MENRELKIKWQDNVKTLTDRIVLLEYHIEQKQRFLEKQTQLVEILSKDKNIDLNGMDGMEEFTSACDQCVYHRDMWRKVRGINLEQQKRCEIESSNARAIQQRQGKQLVQLKMIYTRLRTQYDELMLKRQDPFCRDSEIVKLRHELAESKVMAAGLNRTAFNANNEARILKSSSGFAIDPNPLSQLHCDEDLQGNPQGSNNTRPLTALGYFRA